MALSTLAAFKIHLSRTPGAASDDLTLQQMLDAADKAVKTYCGRDFESATYTEFYSGTGRRDLVLRQRPVTSVTSVHLDPDGYYGDGPGAFASTTLLTAGIDYVLIKDDGTSGKSGLIRRLGGLASTTGGEVGWYPPVGRRGTLAAEYKPVWPFGDGNIKVVYVAGYAATAIPLDLVQAVHNLAAFMLLIAKRGGMVPQSESLGSYSYSLALHSLGTAPELGTSRQLLSRYRELSWG